MQKIYKKIFRDLIKMKLHTIAIILTLACGIGVYSGVDMGMNSLFFTRDKILKDMKLADLEIQILPEDIRNLPNFKNIKGLKHFERRLIMPGTFTLKNNKKLTSLIIFQENLNPKINQVKIIEGQGIDPNSIDDAIAEKTLFSHHGVKPGDELEIKVGEKIYKNKIKGIGISPEFIIITTDPEYLLPEKGSLGVIFTSLKRIDENLGFTMINDLIFEYEPDANPELVQKAILERLVGINLEKVIPFKSNFAYKYLQLDLTAYKIYTPAIIVVLGAITFIITLINFNRLIVQQRKEIGAILALGYTRKKIFSSYALGALTICVLGIIVGLPFSIFLRNTFTHIYSSAHGMILTYNLIFLTSIIKGILFAFFTIGISFFIPLYGLLRFSPREIIHPAVKDNITNSNFIRWIFSKTKFLNISNRIGIRNIFRQKQNTISTILSIALSCGVAISYIVSTTSMMETIRERFNKQKWDIAADFLYPVYYEDYEEIKNIKGVTEVEPYFRHYVELGKDGIFEGSGMMGFFNNSKMKYVPLTEGRIFQNKNEIVLSYDLVKKLKTKLNDKIQIKIGIKLYDFTVVGVKSDVVVGESFIDFTRAREIFEFPDEASGIFIKTNPESKDYVMQEIYSKKFVGKVSLKEKLVDEFILLIQEISGIINIASAISIFIAILFILTSINMGITEREGEYATLKAIGYNKKLIRSIILSEAMLISILSLIIAIPTAMLISKYMDSLMTDAWFKINSYYEAKDFLKVLIPMLILTPLSIIPALRYLNKMDINETLRTKIIE